MSTYHYVNHNGVDLKGWTQERGPELGSFDVSPERYGCDRGHGPEAQAWATFMNAQGPG
jgi:hypothetical protein